MTEKLKDIMKLIEVAEAQEYHDQLQRMYLRLENLVKTDENLMKLVESDQHIYDATEYGLAMVGRGKDPSLYRCLVETMKHKSF